MQPKSIILFFYGYILFFRRQIGPIAKIEKILYTPGLPKTRSGKIMRRILRTIARGEEIKQDISTLEDSGVVEIIVKLAKAEFE